MPVTPVAHMSAPVTGADAGSGTAPALAVELRGVAKLYRPSGRRPAVAALKGVDLAIPRGTIFGLLGPNGAGKSTLINILAGLVIKSSGTVRIWGHDLDQAERRARLSIGVVTQELNIDPFFTPRELLDLHAGLYGVPAAERRTTELLAAVGLIPQADAYARTLSGGMRRRLMVAKAMVHTPPILVLDEPTAGVDVELRRQLWEHVRALNAAGTTVLLTTHYLEEAEALCDTIAIIDHGQVVACDSTDSLRRRIDSKTLTLTLDRALTSLPEGLSAEFAVEQPVPHCLVLRYAPSRQRVDTALDALRQAGVGIIDIASQEANLEDIFLQLTSERIYLNGPRG